MMRKLFRTIVVACTVVFLAACNSSAPQTPPPAAAGHEGHDHAHDHSHEEAGPHGGHLVELGDEEYHLEWTHDDETGLVTLYVLDAAAKEVVPIASETITITAKVTDATDYVLSAVNPSGDPPTASQFEFKSPALIECLKLAGQGTEVSVAVTIDGKDFRADFEHHEHGHHH